MPYSCSLSGKSISDGRSPTLLLLRRSRDFELDFLLLPDLLLPRDPLLDFPPLVPLLLFDERNKPSASSLARPERERRLPDLLRFDLTDRFDLDDDPLLTSPLSSSNSFLDLDDLDSRYRDLRATANAKNVAMNSKNEKVKKAFAMMRLQELSTRASAFFDDDCSLLEYESDIPYLFPNTLSPYRI